MNNTTQNKLADAFAKRFEEYNTKVLEELAEVIKKFDGLTYTQASKLASELKYDKSYIDIIDELSKLTGKSKKEIKKILEETINQHIEFADTFFKARNMKTPVYQNDKYLTELVNSIAKVSEGDFVNLAKSTGFAFLDKKGHIQFLDMKETYYKVIDECVYAISEGKATFQESMRDITKQLVDSGVRRIVYANEGKKQYTQRIDAAVRRNLLDSIREVSIETQVEFGKRFKADGIEVTVHENPAPDHMNVQGHQFRNEEFEKFQNDKDCKDVNGVEFPAESEETGRDRRSIGQYNCYHTVFSIIVGVSKPLYSEKELQEIKDRATEKIDIDGKEYTRYETTQLQRSIETEIRKAKDSQNMHQIEGDREAILDDQQRIKQLTRKYREISQKAGIREQLKQRATVSGYKPIKASQKDIIEEPEDIMSNFTLSDEGILRKKDGADISKITKNQAEELYKQANYTKEEKEKYSSSYFGNLNFRKINDYLRENKDDEIHGIKASTMAKELNNKINNTTSTEDLILYRGINHLSIEDVSKMKIGDIIKDKGIQSTSFNPERAYEVSQTATFFNNVPVMYEIETTKGSNMLISSKIFDNVSLQEYEVVLPSNISLEIKDIQKYKYLTLIKVKYLKK